MPAQPVKPVLCSWGSGGSGGLLHEDCEDRSLLPTSLSFNDADASSAADDTDDTNNAAAADAETLQAAEVEALSRLGRHTILSTATGAVLSCGSNACGFVDPLEHMNDDQVIAKP